MRDGNPEGTVMKLLKTRNSKVLTLSVSLATALLALGLGTTTAQTPTKKSAAPKYILDGVWLGVPPPGASGLGAWPRDKMTEAAKKAAAEFRNQYGNDAPEAGSYCVHTGMPSFMMSYAGYPIEIVTGQKQISMTTETGTFRRIFTDGRKAPTDRPPTSVGYSVAHWEGDVLVIETTSLSERVDSRQMSDQARIVERLYLVDDKGDNRGGIAEGMKTEKGGKMLVDEITLYDPKFYTEPLKFVGNFRRAPDDSVLEYDCGKEFWQAALEEHAKKRKK
jgi:hypothetical protein